MEFKVHIEKDELIKAIDAKLDEIADYIFAESQQLIVDKQIIDEGTLLKSGNIQREELKKTITYSVPYAEVIEYGRLPGTMPPVDAIQAWVQRKLQVSDEKEARKIAWMICQDIKENGTEPRPFLQPAVERAKNKYG